MTVVTGPYGLDISGVTTERPGNAETGYLFYDTTTSELLVWSGDAWVDTATGGDPSFNTLALSGDLTFDAGGDIVAQTTGAGTKIGTAAAQLIGFWGITAVNQPAHADQGDSGDLTSSSFTDPVATQNTGWGSSTEQGFDNIKIVIDKLLADVVSLDTLLSAIRDALVECGIMKGGA